MKITTKIFATLAFWALLIFGGSLVMLVNALAPSLSQYRDGDLGYLVLQIVATPIGAGIAATALDSITHNEGKMLGFTNCVIGATVFAVLALLLLLKGVWDWIGGLSDILTVAVLIVLAIKYHANVSAKTNAEAK